MISSHPDGFTRSAILVTLLITFSILGGCSSMSPAENASHNNMNATLWFQTSAEYEGNSMTVFAAAADRLADLAGAPVTADLEQAASLGCIAGVRCDALAKAALMPAVVLDVDETVLDNGPYQARLARTGIGYDPATWDAWVAERSAAAIPGAVDFIRAARDKGMAVIYITNRTCGQRGTSLDPCPQRADTLANLAAAGFPALGDRDLLILRNERADWNQSEKKLRRSHVARTYRIAMLIGDDLGDVGSDIKQGTQAERLAFVRQNKALFGRVWFQLGNPMYGSWARALDAPLIDHLDTSGSVVN